MLYVVTIVEGHGDVEATPELLRLVASERKAIIEVDKTPIRVKRSSFLRLNDGEYFRTYINMAAERAKCARPGTMGAVLIIMDWDNSPKSAENLERELTESATQIRSDIRLLDAVVAKKCYESWLAAGFGACHKSETYGTRWIEENLRDKLNGGKYRKVGDQRGLTADENFSIADAKKCSSSFCRLTQKIYRMLDEAEAAQ